MSATLGSDHPDGETRTYIIKLKENVDKTSHFNRLQPHFSSQCQITHDYSIIHGYAGHFTKDTLAKIKASGDVERVEEDADTEYYGVIGKGVEVQKPSPWGLNRICQPTKLTTTDLSSKEFNYRYQDKTLEYDGDDEAEARRQKVNIYVIDSGVMIDHEDFENRASWGWVASGRKKEDFEGHGTQVASVVGGKYCGVYKHANIIACKNMSYAEAIKCFNYVKDQCEANKIPSVVNFSGGYYDPKNDKKLLDETVKKVINAGVHVVVAAGKYRADADASSTTPARVEGVIAVGASTIKDEFHSKTNHGSVLKFFAPGCDIYVADKKHTKSYTTKSGTSFAAPHVAGLVAYMIQINGNPTPDAMIDILKQNAIADTLTNIPSDTPNLLINNGFR